jgi:hypothetical protein
MPDQNSILMILGTLAVSFVGLKFPVVASGFKGLLSKLGGAKPPAPAPAPSPVLPPATGELHPVIYALALKLQKLLAERESQAKLREVEGVLNETIGPGRVQDLLRELTAKP